MKPNDTRSSLAELRDIHLDWPDMTVTESGLSVSDELSGRMPESFDRLNSQTV